MDLTPEEFDAASDASEPVAADMTMLENGVLTQVHSPSGCAGRNCWVHNPSPTHLVAWPVVWRAKTSYASPVYGHWRRQVPVTVGTAVDRRTIAREVELSGELAD